MILIGIDPGTHTGYAEWSTEDRKLLTVETMAVHDLILRLYQIGMREETARIYMEDARQRRWFGSAGREKLQGVGSIKRDCAIIEDACKAWLLPLSLVKPQAGGTKWSASRFSRTTGWTGRTSEHARDAALLVFGRCS